MKSPIQTWTASPVVACALALGSLTWPSHLGAADDSPLAVTSRGEVDVPVEDRSAVDRSSLDRSPVDLALSRDQRWLVTANETSSTVSLIDVSRGRVLDEVVCGDHPAAITLGADDHTVLVTGSHSGDVTLLEVDSGRLTTRGRIEVGHHPHGIVVAPDGRRAYVGLDATGQVAVIDLVQRRVVQRIDVGNWPRYLALSEDGKRLAVGCGGDAKIVVVDAEAGEVLYEQGLSNGINLGQMRCSADGKYVYFPWMVYRTNPINAGNIRRGWVLASRIGRVRMDQSEYREALSLDVPGEAVADPHGLVISHDQQRLVVSASGTHELLVYRLSDLPFIGIGGPGDLIDRRLQNDRDRFRRVETGGRPMGIRMACDDRTVLVANYLRNSVQIVDVEAGRIVREVPLGGPSEPSPARRGMAIFYDGRRSLDQWYSCHSCHQDGGVNSRPMDTMNDGSVNTLKTVLPLYHVTRTKPWTWHGWQEDLEDAMRKSLTSTMVGRAPSPQDTEALIAFLDTLRPPPNPFLNPDGSLSEAAERGRRIFHGDKASCANCHNGPHYTDGEIHDVGLGRDSDRYDGFNTPSLLGVYRRVRLTHGGSSRSLRDLLAGPHSPAKVSQTEELTEKELDDLIEFLKSL